MHQKKRHTKQSLQNADRSFLGNLGLSKGEIQIYNVMGKTGEPFSAQRIASEIMIFPSAVYRIFRTLEKYGLIQKVALRPITYIAAKKSEGFNKAYSVRQQELRWSLSKTNSNSVDDQGIILIGRLQLYEKYKQLASKAQNNIVIFSAGIAYSKELFAVQKDALSRAVSVRHIVQHVDSSNFHIIHKWKEIGINVRRLNIDQGFHLTIIDRSIALLTFSNPNDTEDRISVVTKQETAVALFSAQFEQLWSQANLFEPEHSSNCVT